MKIIFFLSLLFFTLSCSLVHNPREVILVLDWTPNTNHTGIYVALKKGYFQKKNVHIKIIQPNKMSAERLVASGKAQLGISSGGEFALSLDQKMPLIAIAAIIQHNTSGFYSLEKRNINSPRDFKNKVYAGWGSLSERKKIQTLMLADHAKPSDFPRMVTMQQENILTVLEQVDFIWGYQAWQGVKLKQSHIKYRYLPLLRYSKELDDYAPLIITSKAFMKENKALLKDTLQAIEQGYYFAIREPLKAAKLLLEEVPELSSKLVIESQKWLQSQYKKGAPYWGKQALQRYETYDKWLFNSHIISRMPSLEQIRASFTNEFLLKEDLQWR
jgi:ABC-type nitrate/sulfonate/bicarbonate transport system substrate-binding protein